MKASLKIVGSAVILLSVVFGSSFAAEIDLLSWSQVGDVEWRVDGTTAEAGPYDKIGFLVSSKPFADFRLSVEFWIEDDTNSGVFIRCPDAVSIGAVKCYEVNIWDNHPNQDSRTGSIVGLAKPVARVDTVGNWSLMEIEAIGENIVVTVNGVETARLRNDRSAAGFIAVQYGKGGLLRFRNISIEAL